MTHVPTEETLNKVKEMGSRGITRTHLAQYLGISKDTFQKHYGEVWRAAKVQTNNLVAGKLFELCMEGNVAAIIFWCKTQGQWKENLESKQPVESDSNKLTKDIADKLPD